jgi:hypothetical protein
VIIPLIENRIKFHSAAQKLGQIGRSEWIVFIPTPTCRNKNKGMCLRLVLTRVEQSSENKKETMAKISVSCDPPMVRVISSSGRVSAENVQIIEGNIKAKVTKHLTQDMKKKISNIPRTLHAKHILKSGHGYCKMFRTLFKFVQSYQCVHTHD